LTPVIGLVSIGGLAMADRYSYFSSVGIFFAVALGAGDLANHFKLSHAAVGTVAGLVLAACLAGMERQLRFWRDDVTLFSHAIEVTKDATWAQFPYLGWLHLRLGIALENEGRKAGAFAELRRALELEPNRAETHKDLANSLAEAGQPREALAEFQEALRLDPGSAPVYSNLGALLVQLGRFDEALKNYAEAARLDPDSAPAHLGLARLLAAWGHPDEALAEFQTALRLNPRSAPAHYNLGILLVQSGRFEEAMKN
jgi:tetratricopeptide (TPR) repeat protein